MIEIGKEAGKVAACLKEARFLLWVLVSVIFWLIFKFFWLTNFDTQNVNIFSWQYDLFKHIVMSFQKMLQWLKKSFFLFKFNKMKKVEKVIFHPKIRWIE